MLRVFKTWLAAVSVGLAVLFCSQMALHLVQPMLSSHECASLPDSHPEDSSAGCESEGHCCIAHCGGDALAASLPGLALVPSVIGWLSGALEIAAEGPIAAIDYPPQLS